MDFPMEANHKLALVNSPLIKDPTQYRRLVGEPNLSYYHTTRVMLCSTYIVSIHASYPKKLIWKLLDEFCDI